jgi:hypothetical protein
LPPGNTLAGQGASKTLVNDLVKHWQASKKLTLTVAEAAPAEAYRPFNSSSGEWNFADEMGSLALANFLSCSLALHTEAPARFQSALDRPMDHSKTGTVKSLRVADDYCIDGLATMDDASLMEMAAFAGHTAIRFDILWNANAHAIYRLGEAEMYLRSKGIITDTKAGASYEF